MKYFHAIRLADAVLDELDRVTDLRFGGSDFKELDSRDLLMLDLYHSTGVARDEFVYECEGGDAALVRN